MISHQPKAVMSRTEHLEAYGLYLNSWTIKEIATELSKTPNVIYSWKKRYGWDWKKSQDLRDIESEIIEKVQATREKIVNAASLTVDDILVKDSDGNITGVAVQIEDVKDLRTVVEILTKAGGLPEKIETKTETKISGDLKIKTEQIDSEMAAEIGKMLALKQSRGE